MEAANHYGNMRFAMFTVFTAIVGALIAFPFSSEHQTLLQNCGSRYLYSLVSIIFSVLFGLSQYRISQLVIFYQEAAFESDSLKKPDGHGCWKNIANLTMLSPYIFSALFWLLFAVGIVKNG
ncbi:hypothetical protein [Methylophilus sp. 5]|uniref:hypothetical protein n=1 Tax=Methylophilus sp. 5 TaxID=1112274 RepID=UPI0009DFABDD|nr:hypothetical protein [Methylophilus sp. 5]